MSTEEAPENDPEIDGGDPEQLDEAIDGLRDVLKQDAEGLDLSSDGAELSAESDIGGDIGSDFGSDLGADFAAGGDLGSDLGSDFGGAGDIGADFGAVGDLGGDLGSDFGAGGDLGGDLGSDFAVGGDLGGLDAGGGMDLGLDASAGAGMNDFGGAAVTGATGTQTRADLVLNIPIDVQVVLGTSKMQVADLMDLSEGATIGLDRKIGEPVEIMVNGKLIGRGEITVLENDDTKFGIKMIEIIGSKPKAGT